MVILDVLQGSIEWKMARAGIPTASEFASIITTKGEPSKSRQEYLYRLAGERITGVPEESYTNGAMQRGVELEEEARQHHSFIIGEEVKKVGLCLTDDGKVGCSPDGLTEKDGAEYKCPSLAVHVGYYLDGVLPTKYFQQVQGSLYVTGRERWWFCSYYPGMKPLILPVYRNEEFIKKLSIELEVFCSELEELVKKLK
jgi:predicted phage-related endonuclease